MKRYAYHLTLTLRLCYAFLQGRFREDNFSAAMATLRDAGEAAKGDKRGRRGGFKGQHRYTLSILTLVVDLFSGDERVQNRENDHGTKSRASHRVQLQQEGLRDLRLCHSQAGLQLR